MAGPAMTYSMVDYADVQGLVRFGYGHMTSASYALVRVKNKAAAKVWLRSAPLLGNRESIPGCPVTGNFTIPGDGTLRRRVHALPQFVTVRGGAYFFLPSLRALRYFAQA